MNPNSSHQLWSRWIITVKKGQIKLSLTEVVDNARRYFGMLFGSVGRIRVEQLLDAWKIIVEVESLPIHDTSYLLRAKQDITERFVFQGFHHRNVSFDIGLLAGETINGKPPAQWIAMPELKIETELHGI